MMIPRAVAGLVLTALLLLELFQSVVGDQSCSTNRGGGGGEENCQAQKTVCGVNEALCQDRASLIYRFGGSAQSYVPLKEPSTSTQVCSSNVGKSKHKVATWPFSRSARSSPSPTVVININLMSCVGSSNSTSSSCCCSPLQSEFSSSAQNSAAVEIWHALPDGTYSSLASNGKDGASYCRSKQLGTRVSFETLIPGSTGCLGGLGPFGLDFAPYGAPTIHLLATAPEHSPVLVDVPIVYNRKTLQHGKFRWPDWRGQAWMREYSDAKPYEIIQWSANSKGNVIELEMNLYLTRTDTKSEVQWCRSWLYGAPSSFFLEPIAVCAPAMFDFFPL